MQPTISLLGQRASASIFCSNLVLDNDRLIVLLSAYGPSQEVRAFAQILYDRDAPLLEIPGKKEQPRQVGGPVSLIAKMDNGYSGLYILPDRTPSSHYREQPGGMLHHLLPHPGPAAVRAPGLVSPPVRHGGVTGPPVIGNKMCYRLIENVPEEVRNRIRYGGFAFPEPTTDITIEVRNRQHSTRIYLPPAGQAVHHHLPAQGIAMSACSLSRGADMEFTDKINQPFPHQRQRTGEGVLSHLPARRGAGQEGRQHQFRLGPDKRSREAGHHLRPVRRRRGVPVQHGPPCETGRHQVERQEHNRCLICRGTGRGPLQEDPRHRPETQHFVLRHHQHRIVRHPPPQSPLQQKRRRTHHLGRKGRPHGFTPGGHGPDHPGV